MKKIKFQLPLTVNSYTILTKFRPSHLNDAVFVFYVLYFVKNHNIFQNKVKIQKPQYVDSQSKCEKYEVIEVHFSTFWVTNFGFGPYVLTCSIHIAHTTHNVWEV